MMKIKEPNEWFDRSYDIESKSQRSNSGIESDRSPRCLDKIFIICGVVIISLFLINMLHPRM